MPKNSLIIFAIISCFVTSTVANAYVASSTNFRIETDSISYGGGMSTSTNFDMQDTLSNMFLGTGTSTQYRLDTGAIAMTVSTITMTDPGSLTLTGEINSLDGGSAEGSVSVNVMTDNPGGYKLTLSGTTLSSGADSFASFSGPAAWSVSDGASAFGFSTDLSTWNGVAASETDVVIENSNNQPSGTDTTITFRAESQKKNQTQSDGRYSSTITLTATVL
ncbi:MAG TPA: hypothetical protein P5056_04085 [Candidatus Paceibacterota bacterium]|nr:hypothetical protein [Candidatus Paceibacterota bacterium]